jgi:hypothetical protein
MKEYRKLTQLSQLSDYENQEVSITGKISSIPWQHLIGSFKGYSRDYYFDVGDDQIVIYSKEEINCTSGLTVYGTVTKVAGHSKDERVNVVYTEYHILVDRWEAHSSVIK